MRPRIKSISTVNGVQPIQSKTVKSLFYISNVKAVKVTTSGTPSQIEAKFAKRANQARKQKELHMMELSELVHKNNIKTKYFAA